ncbi:MAG TPA: hypothetical protein VMW87_14835 [Spirochaetia bacterium]|nr:hypothetical protein [Spirochaetia bacterium]
MTRTICAARAGVMAVLMLVIFTGLVVAQTVQQPDASSLLTRAEIQSALGQSVGEGKLKPRANLNAGTVCEYTVGTGGMFSVYAKELVQGETANRIVEEFIKRKIAVSESTGVGDRSFFVSPGYGVVQLNTFKGSRYLIITLLIPGLTEAAQKTAALELMQKALTRS